MVDTWESLLCKPELHFGSIYWMTPKALVLVSHQSFCLKEQIWEGDEFCFKFIKVMSRVAVKVDIQKRGLSVIWGQII